MVPFHFVSHFTSTPKFTEKLLKDGGVGVSKQHFKERSSLRLGESHC